MTKVLHVVATLDHGGTETCALTLGRVFSRWGLHSRVAALRRGGGLAETQFELVMGKALVLPIGRSSRMLAFAGLCRKYSPDTVLFHFFNLEHVLLGTIATVAGVRRVICVQGNPAPCPSTALAFRKVRLLIWLTRLCRIGLVSASQFIETSMAEVARLPRRSFVIHNGCAIKEIASRAAATRKSLRRSGKTIGMVARLDPIKDHRTLLDSFALLAAKWDGGPVNLLLVGEGPLRGVLKRQCEVLGISNNVQFLGSRGDIPELLGKMDCMVLSTTRNEGFGVVLIEALAAGVPVIASDVPACREVLDGGLGVLVPPGDAKLLAAALLRILSGDATIPSLENLEKRYSAEAMAAKYRRLVGGAT